VKEGDNIPPASPPQMAELVKKNIKKIHGSLSKINSD